MSAAVWELESGINRRVRARTASVTVRRRQAVAVLVLGAVVAAGLLLVLSTSDPVAADTPPGEDVVVVAAAGDTVWSLAMPYAPAGTDSHDWVRQVVRYNALDPSRLQPGAVVRIPQT